MCVRLHTRVLHPLPVCRTIIKTCRIQTKDQLPRPRSVSPRRNQAPPSVSGSSLSAKLERASTVRAKARNVPPVPPPPKTRARFSVKLNAESGSDCDTSSQAGTPATAEAAAAQDEATTPTPGSGSAHVGELTLETDPQQDEAPVVVLPSDITAAQAVSGLGAERRMRDSRRKEQDEDCGGRDRVTGDGGDGDGDGAELVDGRSTGSDFAAAAAVFGGRRRSQIQASPQYWVPRKLSRSPVNGKSKSVEVPPITRPRW